MLAARNVQPECGMIHANMGVNKNTQNFNNRPSVTPGQPFTATLYKMPWVKIALLGLVMGLGSWLQAILIGALGWGAIIVLVIGGGWGGLLAIINFIIGCIVLRFLRKWSVPHAVAVAFLPLIVLWGVNFCLYAKPAILFGYNDIVDTLIPIFARWGGPVLTLLVAFIAYKLSFARIVIWVLTAVFVAFDIFVLIYQPPEPPKAYTTDLKWASLPSYTVPGVQESKHYPCNIQVAADDAMFDCKFYFEDYPGYLSAKTQATIDATRKSLRLDGTGDYFQPKLFFTVHVIHDSAVFDAYKFKNGMCDTNGFIDKVQSDVIGVTSKPRPVQCKQTTTPAGKTVYYEAEYGSKMVQVPTNYYFIQGESIVTIHVARHVQIYADSAQALYLTDENFRPQLFKFIDGFK